MGKASSDKKRRREEDPADRLPNGVSRCSRCGRPWLTERMTPHRNDVLCQVCEEAFQMAVMQANYEVAEAERLIQVERAKHAKMN